MKLTKRQLYDYRDVDRGELKLIRIGHAIWAILRRERRQNRIGVSETEALYDAIETVVRLKREYRDELAIKLAVRNAKLAGRFRPKA